MVSGSKAAVAGSAEAEDEYVRAETTLPEIWLEAWRRWKEEDRKGCVR